MIPAVPLILRLALSAACVGISKVAMAAAGWITPELNGDKASCRREVSTRKPKP